MAVVRRLTPRPRRMRNPILSLKRALRVLLCRVLRNSLPDPAATHPVGQDMASQDMASQDMASRDMVRAACQPTQEPGPRTTDRPMQSALIPRPPAICRSGWPSIRTCL